MSNILRKQFEVADKFIMNTIVSVDELIDHDMIYIYHHLKVGSVLNLQSAGTNVKGDLRYRVSFKGFVLGFVTLGNTVRKMYENAAEIHSTIVAIKKQKFLPIKGLDICLQATKMRMVS